MNIHEAALLPLMIKEIFNIQISACQVINREQASGGGNRRGEGFWEGAQGAKQILLQNSAPCAMG